jgi:hypothetical protein
MRCQSISELGVPGANTLPLLAQGEADSVVIDDEGFSEELFLEATLFKGRLQYCILYTICQGLRWSTA